MVQRRKDQKLRLRNFDARHGRIESAAAVKSRKGSSGGEGRKRYLLPVEIKRPVFARCEQNTFTRHIFLCLSALMMMSHTTLAQGVSARHTIHVSCACVFDLSSTLSLFALFICLSHLLLHPLNLSLHLLCGSVRSKTPLCASANDHSIPLVNNVPLTGYEPKFFDDYHFSETTDIFIQEQSSDSRPSNLHDSEISDDTIG